MLKTAIGEDSETRSEEPLLLSVDFEDWHQLVRRRVGVADWETPGPALAGQTAALLDLLDEIGARATFFVLGIAARAHPRLVVELAARGHEIGCHGDAHLPVHTQTPEEFGQDLRRARQTVAELTGVTPAGYRAPAFSITRESPWAYEVLAQQGFLYDSSQHDSPRIRGRAVSAAGGPRRLDTRGGALWEFPIAVWRTRSARLPVGGASYWAVLPTRLVLHGLERAGDLPALYLHPHELDPHPLRARIPRQAGMGARLHGALRSGQRNLARRRAADVLRAVAGRHSLITYGEAHARLAERPGART